MYLAIKNPFRYRSYYYYVETGLYYLNSRYYDPRTGRFINADDIKIISESKDLLNGLNLYAYCSNNPIMLTDESGEAWWEWLIGILAIATVALLTVVTAGGFTAAGAAFAGALGIGGATSVGGFAGFFAAMTVSGVIGAAIGGVGGGLTSVLSGGSFLDGFSNGFMWGTILGIFAGGLGFFKFDGIGNFANEKFNKLQLMLQGALSMGIYGAKTAANDEHFTFIGSMFAVLSGVAGGFSLGMKFSTQILISGIIEIENFFISLFKHITGIQKNVII